mmetsp:Transcript_582/g.2221  ORF Transcript_582/g.2221 Transcript_582/m.2221 type:complete len:148 (-) Transcript_582:135-578(-)
MRARADACATPHPCPSILAPSPSATAPPTPRPTQVLVGLIRRLGGGGGATGEEKVDTSGALSAERRAAAETAIFGADEVAKHNSRDDCWLIIEGKVYDITDYVDEHPGGDAILNNAGGDATEGFKGPQHPTRVWDELEEYWVGTLAK